MDRRGRVKMDGHCQISEDNKLASKRDQIGVRVKDTTFIAGIN